MKKVLFILFVFLSIKSVGQSPSIIPLKADSVIVYKTGGSAELVIRNSTKNVLGYLYNTGNGITEFRTASGAGSVITTVAGLRLITSPDANTVYETTDYGTGNWYYDQTDITSADNTGTILVAGTKRYKRIYTGSINARWFGSVSLAVTSIGSDSGTVIVSYPISLAANLIVPSNVGLNIIKGGSINNAGHTLAINGAFSADRYQVFLGSGAITFGSGAIDYQFPEWDGAKNDGTDSVAGTRAFALQVARFIPIRLGLGTYLVDSIRTLTGHSLIIVGEPQMFHSILQASSTSAAFIVIGDPTSVEHSYLTNFAIYGTSLSAGGIVLGGDAAGYTAYTRIDNVYIYNFSATGAFGISLKRVQECDINVRFNNNYNALYRPNVGYCTTTHIKGDICYLGRSLNRGASLEGRCFDISFDGITIESNVNEGIYYNATGYGTIRIEDCYFEENSTTGTGTVSITGRGGQSAVTAIIKNNQFHLNHSTDTKMLFLDSVIHSVVSQNYGLMFDSGIVTGNFTQVNFESNNSLDNFTTAYFNRYQSLKGNITAQDDAANSSRYIINRTLFGGTGRLDTLILKPNTNYLNPDRGLYMLGPKVFFGTTSIDDSLNAFLMPTAGSTMSIGGALPSAPVKLSVSGGDIIIDNASAYRSYLSDNTTKKVLLRETASDETELHGGTNGLKFMNGVNAQIGKFTATGNFGVQLTVDPTARVEIKPGSAGAGFSPFKIGFGAKLTVPEPGAIEVDSVDNQIEWTDKNGVRRFLGDDTTSVLQTASYVIEKIYGTTYARPAFKSGLPAYSGTTSSTVINSAIAALTSGGTIFFRKQIDTITAKIVDGGNSNISLIFEKGAILFAVAALNDQVIEVTSVSHWLIYGATIDGNTTNQTNRTVDPSCIYIDGCTDVIVDHAYLYNGHEYGIFFKNNNTSCGIQNSYITLCDWNGIIFGGNNTGGSCWAKNNFVSHCSDVGITTYSKRSSISGNYVYNMDGSLGSNNARWGIASETGFGNTIEDNTIYGVNIGINLSLNSDSNLVKGNRIYAWDLGNGFLGGITVVSNYNTITNNVLSKNFGTASVGFNISGNKNMFNGNRTSGTRGFVISAGDDNILENNTIIGSSGSILLSSASSDNTRIINNDWKGSGGDVTDGGTTTIFSNNIFADGTLHIFTFSSPTVLTGITPVTNGGSGNSTYTVGDIGIGNGTSALTKLVDVAAGSYLRSGGVTTAPVWSTTTLPNSATTGDVLYASASNVYSNLADVAAGSFLRSGGTSTAPVWSTTTIPNSATTGDILSASATSTYSNVAAVASGSLLASAGTSTLPAWSASPTLTTSLTTPLLIGGTGTTSRAVLQSTSGVGTTGSGIDLKVGNNGSVTAVAIDNSGNSVFSGNITSNSGSGTNTFTLRDATLSKTAGSGFVFSSNISSSALSGGSASVSNLTLYSTFAASGVTLTNPGITMLVGNNGAVNAATILNNGNIGIGVASPTSYLQFKAGTASTAPLKFTTGTNLTTAEAGAVEYDGTHLYFTAANAGTRYQLDQQGGGTVTSVAALTLGTTGTDLSSSVANSTTTPVITLNVPTASASNRGALSSTDWSTFNGKQAALVSGTNIKTVNSNSLLGSGNISISGGGVDSVRYTLGSDTAKQYSTGTGTKAFVYERVFNVKDYGAKGDSTTDDTQAIQAAINACSAAGGGTVYMPNGVYLIAGALKTSSPNSNSQLYIPAITAQSALRCHILIKGESRPNLIPISGPIVTATPLAIVTTGVILKTTLTTAAATAGAAVIGSAGPNETFLSVENITIRIKNNPSGTGPVVGGISYKNGSSLQAKNVVVSIDTAGFLSTYPYNDVTGIETPDNNGETFNNLEDVSVAGFYNGFKIGEHVVLSNTLAYVCRNAYNIKDSHHSTNGTRAIAHWSIYDIYISGACVLANFQLDAEWQSSGKWFDDVATVKDSANLSTGLVYYTQITSSSGTKNQHFSKSGGSNLYTQSNDAGLTQTDLTPQTLVVSKSGGASVKINTTTSNDPTTVKFQVSGTDKWTTGMDSQSDGTLDWWIYDHANNKYRMRINGGIVYLGADAITSATTAGMNITTGGSVGVGIAPTAKLHLKAGTATASTAPLKFTTGTSLTTAEAGAVEYDGTNLFFTPTGTIRKSVPTTTIGRSTAQTAAVASVATETVGAADASYMISANVLLTTATTLSFTVTCTYTDEGNTSRTLTLTFSSLSGTFLTSITGGGGAVNYEGVPVHIRAKAGTTITLATTGTFTIVTYNVEGMIQLLK